jgi:putative transposase
VLTNLGVCILLLLAFSGSDRFNVGESVMDDVRLLLTDEIWLEFEAIIEAVKSAAGSPPELSDRDFTEAILYRARTGIPWRDLPACFGAWNAVYQRFRRWEEIGVWKALFEELPEEALEAVKVLFVDSTIVRARQHAAGASAKKGGKTSRASVGAEVVSAPRFTSQQRMSKQPLPSS